MSTTAENFEVLSPLNFLKDVVNEASNAKTRVWMQSMYMDLGNVSQEVTDVLKNTAMRDLDTRLHTDWFGQSTSEGKVLYAANIPVIGSFFEAATIKRKKEMLYDDLEKSGVQITITNTPTFIERIFPYKGRNHMKITIIDEIVYIGGVNFGDKDFTYVDFMVKITDREIVRTCIDIYQKIEKNALEDAVIPCNAESTIVIDSGKTGVSPILETAVAAANTATKSIKHACQFTPDGPFLQALHTAYIRKVAVKVITPYQNTFNSLFALIHIGNSILMKMKHRIIPLHVLHQMVHAKLTIFDTNLAVIGSHNLSEKGVMMRTAEIALFTKNKRLLQNLSEYFDKLK